MSTLTFGSWSMEWRAKAGHARDALNYASQAKQEMQHAVGAPRDLLTLEFDLSSDAFDVRLLTEYLARRMAAKRAREEKELGARQVAYYTGQGFAGKQYCSRPHDFYVPLNQWDKYE